jgi:ABC-2 type transport system ATP-binding protein
MTQKLPCGPRDGLTNGAGKTIPIKMLTTLLASSSGEAPVAVFSITTQAVNGLRAIGYVPEAVSVDGSLSATRTCLSLPNSTTYRTASRRHGFARHWIFMGLTADGGRLVGQYSSGMVRPLEIAQSRQSTDS